MINFDDEKIERLIKKNTVSLNLSYVFFAVALVGAVIAAVLAKGAYVDGKNLGWHLTALIAACVALAGFIITVAGFRVRESRQLKYAVCKKMCEGLLADENFFKGGEQIEFIADHTRDTLSLTRKGYTGEIVVNPAKLQLLQSLGDAGAKIEFDLSTFKPATTFYATIGTLLWQFLQAYYFVKGAEIKVKNVFVTDKMSKTPLTLCIVHDGVTAKKTEKNYFIKKGLIK